MYIYDSFAMSRDALGKQPIPAIVEHPDTNAAGDMSLRKRLSSYVDGQTSLNEIIWNEPDLTPAEIFAYAERHHMSIVYSTPSII